MKKVYLNKNSNNISKKIFILSEKEINLIKSEKRLITKNSNKL